MSKISELNHYSSQITGGGEVIVLDTGSVLNSEAVAMLQALHSRSVGGLRSHLETLEKRGADGFMKNFYVGYGHKSIGDCGGAVIFIEGVSLLVAKAIQDWPLYSGQEASTRYIDFEHQPFKNPIDTEFGNEILENWRAFYTRSLPLTKEHLKGIYPITEGEDEKIYDKAISARAFDVLRGFLPAGATTNLAWSTNLRQAADKVMLLRHHPLKEVRDCAVAIEEALQKGFPNSFGHKHYEATEEYNDFWVTDTSYYHNLDCPEFELTDNSIKSKFLPKEILTKRPAKTELPKHLAEAGTMQFEFLLDFGSFRDLQRHRAVTQRMPLLTMSLGFEEWYFEDLPKDVVADAKEVLKSQKEKIETLECSKEERQYYTAMGYRTSNRLTGGLPAIVYLVELRATRFVHPTLRKIAKQMAEILEKEFSKDGLKLHLDTEMDRFDVKRGTHDITLK
jgi:thymidylate synthase ThyX